MSKSDDRLRRLRQAAQLLHRPRGKNDPTEVVRHLVGMQAQVPDSTAIGIWTRTRDLEKAGVDRARLEERSIVWTWAMRGTLHFVATEDLGWLHPLVVESSIPRAHRRLVQEGVPARKHEDAVKEIRRILNRSAPLTRPQLAERLERKGIRTKGQAIAHLVWLAAAEGASCYGPEIDGKPAFVLMDDWIGPRKPVDRESALKEFAIRYLRSHGPATVADLAFWSGLKMSEAKRAWGTIENRLNEMKFGTKALWMLKTQRAEARPGLIRLLPAFDEYLLGWKDRSFVVGPRHWKMINAGGGWLHPVILSDGQAVGTWIIVAKGRDPSVGTNLFVPLPPASIIRLRRQESLVRSLHAEGSDRTNLSGPGWPHMRRTKRIPHRRSGTAG